MPNCCQSNWMAFLFLLLTTLIGCVNCTFKLDPFKSSKLLHLFLQQNLSIQVDILQQNQTEINLFRVVRNADPIFRLATSTIDYSIIIEYQLENGRARKRLRISCPFLRSNDQFHKIIFILNRRKLSLAENCRQLYTSDHELTFDKFNLGELSVIVGPDAIDGDRQKIRLREFTADAAIQLESRCPHFETIIDNQIYEEEEYIPNRTGEAEQDTGRKEQEESDGRDRGRRVSQKQSKKESNEADAGETALQRIELLESRISHWTELFNRFESRIKRVELHQRGCAIGSGGRAQMLAPGQRIQNLTDCTECQCGLDSSLHCKPIGCPRLECTHPVQVQGQCCPQCGKKCLHNGKYYESGDLFWPKQCTFCLCDDGKMECGFRFPNNCPVLDCAEQETLPNQCCPVCVNIDHCALGRNPCSENATCNSGRHSAICHCKEGFFGNGTICTDVDECLWDDQVRKQLGGCGDGTVCINLPGSFKCECLPGYQMIDSRNCLDIIRI